MTVSQFIDTPFAAEELITVDSGIGHDSIRLWSTYEGWCAQAFGEHVRDVISFVDKSQDVADEFIDSAIKDGLSVFDAVSTYFEGTTLLVNVELHVNGETGLLDIDIEGIDSVRRVKLPMGIKQGDMFNVYYAESSKGGGTWDTDLVTTLNNFFK